MKNKNTPIKKLIAYSLIIFLVSCSHTVEKPIQPAPEKKDTVIAVVDTIVKTDTLTTIEVAGIEFGYSNDDGKQLLISKSDTLINADKLTKVISNKNELTNITFIECKRAGKEDNGRQTYYNFKNAGGYLYNVTNAKLDKDKSTVVFSDEFLADRELVTGTAVIKGTLSKKLKDQIEKGKNRKIKKLNCLKTIDANKAIYCIEFENKKDTALASLIYTDDTTIIYKDFPAKYDATSTWRVDDGGKFDSNSLAILAVFNHKNTVELIVDWAGAEGYNTDYYIEENGKFVSVKNAYRYCAPE